MGLVAVAVVLIISFTRLNSLTHPSQPHHKQDSSSQLGSLALALLSPSSLHPCKDSKEFNQTSRRVLHHNNHKVTMLTCELKNTLSNSRINLYKYKLTHSTTLNIGDLQLSSYSTPYLAQSSVKMRERERVECAPIPQTSESARASHGDIIIKS